MFVDAKPNLLSYFTEPAKQKQLPSAEVLLTQAAASVDRYASQDAYQHALSTSHAMNAPEAMKVMIGPLSQDSHSI